MRQVKHPCFLSRALASAVLTAFLSKVSQAADNSYGAKLYEQNCETCHHIDENIIRPDKTMDKSEKLKTRVTFKKFLSRQNGLMPPYLTIVRKDKDLQALYSYIKYLNADKHRHSKAKIYTEKPES